MAATAFIDRDNPPRLRLALVYWGRRGITRLTLDVARAMVALPDVHTLISVARSNELFDAYGEFGDRLLPIETFRSTLGVLPALIRLPQTLGRVRRQLVERRIEVVVVLMPHLWTPFLGRAVKRADLGYVVVVHDGVGHAGDPTAFVNRWLEYDLARADRVVTLSRSVAGQLRDRGLVPAARLRTLWLPDQGQDVPAVASSNGRLRLLFFGRILPYKGLDVLVDAVERLAAEGLLVEFGVFGDGVLGPLGERLRTLGAEVDNRWIAETEVGALLARHDVVVLPYRGASQSGVIAAANGAGLPVVITPVGGGGRAGRSGPHRSRQQRHRRR